MNLGRKYALVGALWGAVVGYGLVAVATGLGVTFIWALFSGGGTAPDSTSTVLYGLAALALIVAVGGCALFGCLYGQRLDERMGDGERAGEHRRANLLAGGALLALVVGGYSLYTQETAMRDRQGHTDRLLDERHAVAALELYGADGGRGLGVTVTTGGGRAGEYILTLTVTDEVGRRIYNEREVVDLAPGEQHHTGVLPWREMVAKMAPAMAAGDRIEAVVTVTATLTTVLTNRELRLMPPHLSRNYLAPDSPFHTSRSVTWMLDIGRADGDWQAVAG